ncbi:MAG: hypothetical protein ACLTK8_00045 [Paeniclostridium sp.]
MFEVCNKYQIETAVFENFTKTELSAIVRIEEIEIISADGIPTAYLLDNVPIEFKQF